MARGLSGTTQYLSRADQTELRVAAPMALSLWFKGGAQGNFKYIASKLLLAGEHPSYGFATGNSGQLAFYIGFGTSVGNVTASKEAGAGVGLDNAWHHLLGTYDQTNVRFYVDGSEQTPATSQTSAIAYANLALYVGSFDGTQLYATGSVAEMALFNAIPNADERAALANGHAPLVVKPSAVVGYWPLIGRYSPEIDVRQGMSLTVTSATTADHTRVFQRIRSLWVPPPTSGTPPNIDAALTVTATLAAAVIADRPAAASLSATATLTAAATGTRPAAASLAATATLTAAADRTATVDASLPVTATLTAADTLSAVAAAPLAVTATLAAALTGTRPADASLAITATAAAAAARTAAVAASLPAVATLAAGLTLSAVAAAPLSVTATLTADAAVGTPPIQATASLSVTATLAAGGTRTGTVDSALVVTATLAAAATGTHPVGAVLVVTTTLTAGANTLQQTAAALAVLATLVATASASGSVIFRPNTGTTSRTDDGLIHRPFTGVTAR